MELINCNKPVEGSQDPCSKTALMVLLQSRLLQRSTLKESIPRETVPLHQFDKNRLQVPYCSLVHRGFYSEKILKSCYQNGIREDDVVRAMKFGIGKLDDGKQIKFGFVKSPKNAQTEISNEEFYSILKFSGCTGKECSNILLSGLFCQEKCILSRLMATGIDVAGVLSWTGTVTSVTPRTESFLNELGIDQKLIKGAVKNGIDEESLEILNMLGYGCQQDTESMYLDVICQCNLSSSRDSLDRDDWEVEEEYQDSVVSTDVAICNTKCRICPFIPPPCTCGQRKDFTEEESPEQKLNYFRDNLIVPLAWAIARMFEYGPTDPKHYLAYQLLRWRYGNVAKSEMDRVRGFVDSEIIKIEARENEKARKISREKLEAKNAEAARSIACQVCWKRQENNQVKERCLNCTKVWIPRFGACNFPNICSSCRLSFPTLSLMSSNGSSVEHMGE